MSKQQTLKKAGIVVARFGIWVGMILSLGWGTDCFATPVKPEMMAYHQEDCLTNETARSCAWMGAQLEKQGKRDQARSFYEKACRALIKPIGTACYLWGLLEKKPGQQAEAFQLACQLKDADGCTALAEILMRRGQREQAMTLYRKACTGKDGRACHRLARHAFQQKKVQDALQWLRYACAYGYPPGCGLLGQYYETQMKNLVRAEKAYQVGCRWKGAAECYRLALLYQQQKKHPQTQSFLQKACTLRFSPACRALQSLRKSQP